MSVYLEFLKKSFRQCFAYKLNSYIQIASAMFKIFVQISVWTALYSGKGKINGVSLQEMVSYLIINMIIANTASSNIGNKIGQKVSEGIIGVDFIRPVSFKIYLIAEDLGETLFKIIFNVLPVCIFVIVFCGLILPDRPISIILFSISFINGIILMYQIDYVFGLLAFWFKTAFYMEWFLKAFFELFAGTFVPLWFYPDLLYRISMYLPFRYVLFDPISIYLGKVPIYGSYGILLVQFVWIIVLQLIESLMWNRIKTIVTVDGG